MLQALFVFGDEKMRDHVGIVQNEFRHFNEFLEKVSLENLLLPPSINNNFKSISYFTASWHVQLVSVFELFEH